MRSEHISQLELREVFLALKFVLLVQGHHHMLFCLDIMRVRKVPHICLPTVNLTKRNLPTRTALSRQHIQTEEWSLWKKFGRIHVDLGGPLMLIWLIVNCGSL